jgi:hypothetical protein
MESLPMSSIETVVVALGLLVRLAVPFAVLALLTTGLRRWESRRTA